MKLFGALSSLVLGAASVQAFQTLTSRKWGHPSNTEAISSRLHVAASAKVPGSAKLDTPWEELGFEFRPTNSHVRITYKDGEWGKPELVKVRFEILFHTVVIDISETHLGGPALPYRLIRIPLFRFTLGPLRCIMDKHALKV